LVITKRDRRITQPFAVYGGYVQLSELEKQTTYFPIIHVRAKYFDVNVFSAKYGDIKVKVRNEEDKIVYSDTVEDVYKLHKRFRTKDLQHGSYTVEVIVHGESFYYDLEKE
jgi:hypothetical protein